MQAAGNEQLPGQRKQKVKQNPQTQCTEKRFSSSLQRVAEEECLDRNSSLLSMRSRVGQPTHGVSMDEFEKMMDDEIIFLALGDHQKKQPGKAHPQRRARSSFSGIKLESVVCTDSPSKTNNSYDAPWLPHKPNHNSRKFQQKNGRRSWVFALPTFLRTSAWCRVHRRGSNSKIQAFEEPVRTPLT